MSKLSIIGLILFFGLWILIGFLVINDSSKNPNSSPSYETASGGGGLEGGP